MKLTDANGGATQHLYDAKNRLLTRTDPLLKNETYQYDGNDNTVKATDRKAQITNQTYDALDRPITTTFADGSSVVNTYDKANRLTQVIDSQSGTITRSYDGLNRLTSETTAQGSVSYGYDAASRRISMTVAGQTAITYTYDNADRLTKITQGTANVSLTYDTASRRTSLTLPNGIIATYGYDTASQLTAITYKLGAAVVGDLAYTYDALGQRTNITGSLARTNLPSAVTTATNDVANRVTNWNGTAITYDLNGNMLNDGSRTYTWDARNRLVATGPTAASFKYDPLGRRISKTIAGVTTNYLYDGLNPVQELTGATPSANLLTGLNIDERFRRTDSLGARDFLVDALGSTLALADSMGTIQTSYTYEPYGNTTVTGQANSNPYQYTGRERDGTGLYYYRARYYDPVRQRFVSEDPIGLAGGLNQYSYVGGNPVSFADPTGLCQVAVWMGGYIMGWKPCWTEPKPPSPPGCGSSGGPGGGGSGSGGGGSGGESGSDADSGDDPGIDPWDILSWVGGPGGRAAGFIRHQVFKKYASRKAAKDAAAHSPPGPFQKGSKTSGPEQHSKGDPHFHDGNHNDPTKPNVHYQFPGKQF